MRIVEVNIVVTQERLEDEVGLRLFDDPAGLVFLLYLPRVSIKPTMKTLITITIMVVMKLLLIPTWMMMIHMNHETLTLKKL